MSGSSLDGLDICHARFREEGQGWEYEIVRAVCYPYEEQFGEALRVLPQRTAVELAFMHTYIGKLHGLLVNRFFTEFPESREASLIVSHGQTIFHQPENGFTCQIGCGATLSAVTDRPVVCDLRTMDVALGGQGAPLVPLGERYLFPAFRNFLNIGGICNISSHIDEHVLAYDVCPGNTLLNYFARKAGKPFDEHGYIARQGKVDHSLLEQLNRVAFHEKNAPKSLGTEHILSDWLPLTEAAELTVPDTMATIVEHIAVRVAETITTDKVLVTGGGAFNHFLMERIRKNTSSEVIVPSGQTVEFKEALIMAFLGLLRYQGNTNCWSAVTGASRDSLGGAIYGV